MIAFALSIVRVLCILPLLLPFFPSCVVFALAPPAPPHPPPPPPPPPPSGDGMNNSSANVSSATTTSTGPYIPGSSTGSTNSDATSQFNPSMAIVIVVLLSAFFFMGFFSVYVRRCTTEDEFDPNNAHNNNYSSSNTSFYNGNLSFRSAVRRQLQAGGDNRPPHGLDLFLVNSLPTVRYAREEAGQLKAKGERKAVPECVVCLSEFEEGETLRLLPNCGHSFHQDCIDMWLFSHTTCPLCRRSLLHDKNGGDKEKVYGDNIVNPTDQQGGNLRPINANDSLGSSPAPSPAPEIVVNIELINASDEGGLPLMRRSHSTGHSLVKGAAVAVGDTADGMSGGRLLHDSSPSSNISPLLNPHNYLQAIDAAAASSNPPSLHRSRSYTMLTDLEGMRCSQAIRKVDGRVANPSQGRSNRQAPSLSSAPANALLQAECLPSSSSSSSKGPVTASARSASPPISISKAFKRLAGLDRSTGTSGYNSFLSRDPCRSEFVQLAYVL